MHGLAACAVAALDLACVTDAVAPAGMPAYAAAIEAHAWFPREQAVTFGEYAADHATGRHASEASLCRAPMTWSRRAERGSRSMSRKGSRRPGSRWRKPARQPGPTRSTDHPTTRARKCPTPSTNATRS